MILTISCSKTLVLYMYKDEKKCVRPVSQVILKTVILEKKTSRDQNRLSETHGNIFFLQRWFTTLILQHGKLVFTSNLYVTSANPPAIISKKEKDTFNHSSRWEMLERYCCFNFIKYVSISIGQCPTCSSPLFSRNILSFVKIASKWQNMQLLSTSLCQITFAVPVYQCVTCTADNFVISRAIVHKSHRCKHNNLIMIIWLT